MRARQAHRSTCATSHSRGWPAGSFQPQSRWHRAQRGWRAARRGGRRARTGERRGRMLPHSRFEAASGPVRRCRACQAARPLGQGTALGHTASPSGKEGHRRGRAIGQGAGRRAVKKARIGMDRKTFRSGNDAREYEMTSSCTCVRGARAAAPAISGAPGRSWRPGGRADAQSSGC